MFLLYGLQQESIEQTHHMTRDGANIIASVIESQPFATRPHQATRNHG